MLAVEALRAACEASGTSSGQWTSEGQSWTSKGQSWRAEGRDRTSESRSWSVEAQSRPLENKVRTSVAAKATKKATNLAARARKMTRRVSRLKLGGRASSKKAATSNLDSFAFRSPRRKCQPSRRKFDSQR